MGYFLVGKLVGVTSISLVAVVRRLVGVFPVLLWLWGRLVGVLPDTLVGDSQLSQVVCQELAITVVLCALSLWPFQAWLCKVST